MNSQLKRPIERIAYRRPEAAAALGISETKFRDLEARGLMPQPYKLDDMTLFDAGEVLDAWNAIKSGSPKRGHREQNPYDT